MTLTHNQLQALTWHACETRRTTPDCGPWDAPGTYKAISEICGTWTYNTAHDHVTAHARDPKARTPYAMRGSRPNLEAASSHKYPMRAGDPNECRIHKGEHRDHCSSCHADAKVQHPSTPPRVPPPGDAPPAAESIANIRAALRKDTSRTCFNLLWKDNT